jgi:hypothetical protein
MAVFFLGVPLPGNYQHRQYRAVVRDGDLFTLPMSKRLRSENEEQRGMEIDEWGL